MNFALVGLPVSVLINSANSDVDPTEGYRFHLDVTPSVDYGPTISSPSCATPPLSRFGNSAAACWPLAPRSAPTRAATAASRPTSCSMPAAAARCAASSTRAPARATPSTIRWAAPASSKAASNSASASASRGRRGLRRCRQRLSRHLPNSRCSRPASAPASALRYYTDFGPMRVDVGLPLNRTRRRSAVRHLCQPGADLLMRARGSWRSGAGAVVGAGGGAFGLPPDAIRPARRGRADLADAVDGPDGGLEPCGAERLLSDRSCMSRASRYRDREGPWLTVGERPAALVLHIAAGRSTA